MAAVAILLPSTLATFDASANTNMAVYWVSLRLVERHGHC